MFGKLIDCSCAVCSRVYLHPAKKKIKQTERCEHGKRAALLVFSFTGKIIPQELSPFMWYAPPWCYVLCCSVRNHRPLVFGVSFLDLAYITPGPREDGAPPGVASAGL